MSPYYIEVLHKEGEGGDHLQVAWQKPDTVAREVITGAYLSSWPLDDTIAPEIELIGSSPTSVNQGEPYEDRGAKAQDETDGDLSDRIVVTNPVDTSVPGRYRVLYDVRDLSANEAKQVVRIVKVRAKEPGGAQLQRPTRNVYTASAASLYAPSENHQSRCCPVPNPMHVWANT